MFASAIRYLVFQRDLLAVLAALPLSLLFAWFLTGFWYGDWVIALFVLCFIFSFIIAFIAENRTIQVTVLANAIFPLIQVVAHVIRFYSVLYANQNLWSDLPIKFFVLFCVSAVIGLLWAVPLAIVRKRGLE